MFLTAIELAFSEINHFFSFSFGYEHSCYFVFLRLRSCVAFMTDRNRARQMKRKRQKRIYISTFKKAS